MDESQEPLLDNNNIQFPRTERKNKGKLSETTFIPKSKSFALDLQNYNKDSKTKKIENKFIFKVYLHFFGQIVFILIMTLLAFKNKTFNSILSNNKILFIISIIIIFILLIYPLKYEQLLKSLPYNYIYLSLFTISIAYVICKILISFNSNLIEAGAILSECVINTKTIFSFNFQPAAIHMYLDAIEYIRQQFYHDAFISGFFVGLGSFCTFAAKMHEHLGSAKAFYIFAGLGLCGCFILNLKEKEGLIISSKN